MYEIKLELDEIINYNKMVKVFENGITKKVGIVITNYHFMMFDDITRKIEFQDVLRIARGVNPIPKYELAIKEKIANIKCYYEENNTIIEISNYKLEVLNEHLPLPVL